ncbi:hypothetical protein [Pseudokineococcus sp. 1T1Z-3]|uniref:hypothetical protein n=1 Tax=Pseudokineococcus sp. 1T1Z-3 TaxID=3132745 RepID=UPI0030A51348
MPTTATPRRRRRRLVALATAASAALVVTALVPAASATVPGSSPSLGVPGLPGPTPVPAAPVDGEAFSPGSQPLPGSGDVLLGSTAGADTAPLVDLEGSLASGGAQALAPAAADGGPDVPMPDPAYDSLTVEVSQESIAGYWYWAEGVEVAISGLPAWGSAVVRGYGPAGVETFMPLQADADGEAVVRVSTRHYSPELGTYTIVVTGADGSAGRSTLEVVRWERDVFEVSTDPSSITRHQWRRSPVTVRVEGMEPGERLTLHMIGPDGAGFQVDPTTLLVADEDGTFSYDLQAATADVTVGTWDVTALAVGSNRTGTTTLEVLEGRRSAEVGTMTVEPSTIDSQEMVDPGITYVAEGLRPWDVVSVVLHTPTGTEAPLGNFRASNFGRLADGVSSSSPAPPGTYELVATSIFTTNTTSGTFEVTGDGPQPPTGELASDRLTRLDVIDPSTGVVVHAEGLEPGALATMDVRSRTNVRMRASDTSVTTTRVASDGSLVLRLSSAEVVERGTYTVTVSVASGTSLPVFFELPLEVRG